MVTTIEIKYVGDPSSPGGQLKTVTGYAGVKPGRYRLIDEAAIEKIHANLDNCEKCDTETDRESDYIDYFRDLLAEHGLGKEKTYEPKRSRR
jgi:hypothetical protein